jgi:hypothetical protein
MNFLKTLLHMNQRAVFCFLAVAATLAVYGQGYIIESVDYIIEGQTRMYPLSVRADIQPGAVLVDRQALETYLSNRRQVLMNERVLESVTIETEAGPERADGLIPLSVTVRVVDTWNLIALPYFRFDSNTGLLLSVRARDYNFLGSMNALRVNFNLDRDLDGDVSWGSDADFSLPFTVLGLDWSWTFGAAFSVPAYGGLVSGSASTTLDAAVPLGAGQLELGLSQSAWLNRTNSDGQPYADTFYLRGTFSAAWRVQQVFGDLSQALVLRPRLEVSSNWLPGGLGDPDLDDGPLLNLGTGLSFGRVDWYENFRRGISISMDGNWGYFLLDHGLSRSFRFEVMAFSAFSWAGPSARLMALWHLDGTSRAAGIALRGILNTRASTDAAVVLNLDLPVRVLRFMPYEWFNQPWMRFFQFEQHWGPFLDLSLGHYGDAWFDPDKGWYGAGLEVLTYPLAMRSFYVRISLGFSIPDILALGSFQGISPRDNRGISEVFIGIGHHY